MGFLIHLARGMLDPLLIFVAGFSRVIIVQLVYRLVALFEHMDLK